MKNVTNTYGYYLTEDSETIEYRGNFAANKLLLKTKNPDEQLNYKVFVSPKKAINFAIQIVGGTNPQVIYIPQHIYKDLQTAYNEDNPYYTINNITVIKLDFTDSGSALIQYLKKKFEELVDGSSKISRAGVTGITNYAGFDSNGNPNDESILRQILFLFEEQNDIIFVDKNVQLVTEDIVNSRGYKSNRIKGDFTYTSNYFDGSGKFNSPLLNSQANIKLESSTLDSVLQLNDFVKDYAGKSLQDVNSVYKSNIVKDEEVKKAPNIQGAIIAGLSTALPLLKLAKDKISQLRLQKTTKQLEEAKAIGRSGLSSINDQAAGAVGNARNLLGNASGQATGAIDSAKDQATGAIDSVKNILKKPVVPQISNKVPDKVTVKPVSNEYKETLKQFVERDMQEKAARLAGLSDDTDYDEDAGGNRIYEDPEKNAAYQSRLEWLRKKESVDKAFESVYTPKALSNKFNIPAAGGVSNVISIPSAGGVSNPISIPSAAAVSNTINVPSVGAVSNAINIPSAGGVSNAINIPKISAVSNTITVPKIAIPPISINK